MLGRCRLLGPKGECDWGAAVAAVQQGTGGNTDSQARRECMRFAQYLAAMRSKGTSKLASAAKVKVADPVAAAEAAQKAEMAMEALLVSHLT